MTATISLGAILSLVGTISTLLFVLAIVSIFNSALIGDAEAVKQELKEIENVAVEDVKWAPIQPFVPYILGGVAVVLTAICGALGLPIIFRK